MQTFKKFCLLNSTVFVTFGIVMIYFEMFSIFSGFYRTFQDEPVSVTVEMSLENSNKLMEGEERTWLGKAYSNFVNFIDFESRDNNSVSNDVVESSQTNNSVSFFNVLDNVSGMISYKWQNFMSSSNSSS